MRSTGWPRLPRPMVGVITNAFPAHLESMGSVEAVARAKGELFLRLPPVAGPSTMPTIRSSAGCPSPPGVTRLSFGLHGAEVSAVGIESQGRHGRRLSFVFPGESCPVRLKAFGLHNV